MRRELQLQLTVEPPVQAHHRTLRRCYGCGNYTRPFVEMDGVIRCEQCARKAGQSSEDGKDDIDSIEAYGRIT
ncbi:MAG TPA: hypothetical protein VIY96_09335 [Thermoanaerobaculia bacterium]